LAAPDDLLRKPIPATGETIPAIGMGTWLTFDIGEDAVALDTRVEVLETFFRMGGGMVDSSPMYGSAEAVVGHCLERVADAGGLFSATKVWTMTRWLGISQMEASEELWGESQFDLMQVHNLLDWETHIETLLEWKAAGRVRYVGITTSHGRRHEKMMAIMERHPIDFVQLTYNIADRDAEARLLPLAAERGQAVIANRPFQRGALLDRLAAKPLPGWAAEIDCANWPQFLLKFIVSHPAVTCAIPATSRPDHMAENMGALSGRLPGASERERMLEYVRAL
jgi:diketogulonate reductase-like aldo/keto reductase